LELQSESLGLPRKTITRPFCKKISATLVEKEQQNQAAAWLGVLSSRAGYERSKK